MVWAQAKQEYKHYHSGHQTIVLCIYYSTSVEMAKQVSILIIGTKKFIIIPGNIVSINAIDQLNQLTLIYPLQIETECGSVSDY